jgi:hypothetical protein
LIHKHAGADEADAGCEIVIGLCAEAHALIEQRELAVGRLKKHHLAHDRCARAGARNHAAFGQHVPAGLQKWRSAAIGCDQGVGDAALVAT